MSSTAISPNWREVLSAQSDITGRQEYLTSHDGALNINGSFSIAGSPLPIAGATTAIVTAIVDASGNQISSFGGGTQYTDGGVPPAHPVGPTLIFDNAGTWANVSDTSPLPVSGSFTPPALQNVNITEIGGDTISLGQTDKANSVPVTIANDQSAIFVKTDAGDILDVSVVSSALPSGAATESTLAIINGKLVSGTDIGDVTINNAAGAAAVNIQDGGNTITVDGAVAVSGTVAVTQSTSPWIVAGGGTAGSAATGVITVQGIASMTPVQVSQATAANLNMTEASAASILTSVQLIDDTVVAQGTALGSTKNSLVGGSVTTNAPTYTTGNINPLSLTTAGGLRVDLKDTASNTNNLNVNLAASAATVTVSATNLSTNIAQIGGATVTQGSGIATNALRVELANNGTGVIATVGAVTAITNALPAGTNAIGKLAANSGVDIGDVDVTTVGTITPGTAASSLGKAEDAVHNSGDVGVFGLAVANEAQTSLAADGDYIGHATDTKGNTLAVGNIAHDGVDAGNPVKIGGKARTAPPTAVAASDRVDGQFDIYGKQIVREALREDLGWQQAQISSSTSETTIVTADSTYKLDIYMLSVANTSATATKVTLKDSTTGTTRWVGYIPAGDMRGFAVSPSGALKQNAANNNWTLTCGTSVAAIEVTAAWVRSL